MTTSIKPRANRPPHFLPFPKRNALFGRFELRLLFSWPKKMAVHPHAAAVFLVCPFSAVVSLQHNTVHCMTFPFISISARICRSNLFRIRRRRPRRYNTRRFGIFVFSHFFAICFLVGPLSHVHVMDAPLVSLGLWGVHLNQKGSCPRVGMATKRNADDCSFPLPSH